MATGTSSKSKEKINQISTFVFMDLESTCLLNDPNCRITELCMIAVSRKDLEKTSFPRVTNKLTICLNPKILLTPNISTMTGLENRSLQKQKAFTKDTVKLLNAFISHLQGPVCLLAHYGNGFDFQLLALEMRRLNRSLDSNLLCADTLEAIESLEAQSASFEQFATGKTVNPPSSGMTYCKAGDSPANSKSTSTITQSPLKRKPAADETSNSKKKRLDQHLKMPESVRLKAKLGQSQGSSSKDKIGSGNNIITRKQMMSVLTQKRSYKLVDIYERIFDRSIKNSHTAEGDCIALLEIAQYFDGFEEWVDKNATLFSDAVAS